MAQFPDLDFITRKKSLLFKVIEKLNNEFAVWDELGGALLRRDQALAAALVILRHAANLPAGSGPNGASGHAGRTAGRKERLWSQEFSKQKMLEVGMEEDMESRMGCGQR